MAFSPKETLSETKFLGLFGPNQRINVPGKAATAYTAGDKLYKEAVGATANAGLFSSAGDSQAPPWLTCTKTVTTAANTVGFPDGLTTGSYSKSEFNPNSDDIVANTLVECAIDCAVYLELRPVVNYADDTISAYTAATPSVTLTTALGANDDPNGGIIYIYDGPGAGQWNHIVDYANSTKIATLARAFNVAPTSASSCIILEGEGSSVGGVGTFGRVDLHDDGLKLDVADGADDGDFIVLADGWLISEYLGRWGALPVARYTSFA